MALLTSVSLAEAQQLGTAFGLQLSSIEPLSLGSVNSNFRLLDQRGSSFFGRVYEEQPRSGAETELQLLWTLADAGVPVVRPLRTESGVGVLELQGKPFAIFPWVAGDWLCLRDVTAQHCFRVGAALASVHLASSQVEPLPQGRFQPENMLERLRSVDRSATPELAGAIAAIRKKYAEYLPRRVPLPQGVCHGDLFRDNVLWQADRLSALLDFESASWGNFSYDVMVTILAWCFLDSLHLANARSLVAGYLSVRPLSAAERAAFEVEGALACLRFASTRISDFELRAAAGERPARDYRRFLQRLAALEAGAFRQLSNIPTEDP